VKRKTRLPRLRAFSIAAMLATALAIPGIAVGSASAAAIIESVPGTFGLNGIACPTAGT